MTSFQEIEARIDQLGDSFGRHMAALAATADGPEATASFAAEELLRLGEACLELWLEARGEEPTQGTKEGFRLLALHRQGAKGDPSFNACRETCRELAYHYNLVTTEPRHRETERRLKMATMVARHLCLFVSGKMQVAGLGEFCCSSRPLRSTGG
ncbi:MAG: hypothetical protein AB7E70_16620 [Hyphomicrobiaceae bacterium]